MSKHLVVFCPVVQWPVHFETDLEIAQQHLDMGWKVTFLQCSGALPSCAQNPYHRTTSCKRCVTKFKKGIRWLGNDRVTVREFQCLTEEQKKMVSALSASSFATLDDLKRFTVDEAEIGLAVIGSVISFLREPKPDLRQYQTLFTAYLQAAVMVLLSIRNQLSVIGPDAFVLFNGRFTELRVALYAAKSLQIPTVVHERAGVLNHYSLLNNTSPHDIAVMKKAIDATYLESLLSEDEKKKIAFEWYTERRSNKAQSWYSFTAKQREGLLPDFAQNQLNLVVFNSSEDEIESFDDWRNPYYTEQNEGIERIVSELGEDSRFKLFLRIHPNLMNINNSQTKGIARLEKSFPSLTVIPADSPMSTYGILDTCDIVLVFGSTIGIEAAYSGKPSFLMGRSFYEDLGCCVRPDSHEDLMRLLTLFAAGERSMLPTKNVAMQAVVKYGYFQKTWGKSYKYVRPCHVGKSVMIRDVKETVLRPSVLSWLIDNIVTFIKK